MRYSPAGVPVLDCVLTHTSQALEAGAMRQVSANIKAVALGAVAQQLDQQTLGQTAVFEGFIASPASRRSVIRPMPQAAASSAVTAGSPAAITVAPCAAGASWYPA